MVSLVNPTSCPSDNTLAACHAGDLGERELGAVHGHLDTCGACRALVADLGRDAADAAGLPAPGDLLGRYVIRRVIGVGGMGIVYEAHDPSLDRRVAVKLLRPDLVDRTAAHDATCGGAGAQLLAEAQAMARLRHPNIAVAHDVGMARGQLFLCMEYIDGVTLRVWLDGAPETRAILDAFLAAGRGLAYVHARGLVHLDFKPDNVLVARGDIVVTDFGVAAMVRAIGNTFAVVGTPRYMAPEQRGAGPSVDARADQYAFCVALREALAGRRVGRAIDRAIARGLAVPPGDRFATMDALLAALDPPRLGTLVGRRLRTGATLGLAATTALALAALAGSAPITPARARVGTRVIAIPTPTAMAEAAAHRATSDARSPALASLAPREPARRDGPSGWAEPVVPRAASSAGTAVAKAAGAAPWHALAAPPQLRAVQGGPSSPTDPAGLLEARRCDDAFGLTCPIEEPSCPTGTSATLRGGCWTCADDATCQPLGLPRSCGDGSVVTDRAPPPTCGLYEDLVARRGAWACVEAFRCGQRGAAVPRPRTNQPEPSPGPAPGPTCGNGFCEAGETHASCAGDCCQIDETGVCAPQCGNGFCETGETHASCGGDCCETTTSGACVAQCGNGFCEAGETASECPTDCTACGSGAGSGAGSGC